MYTTLIFQTLKEMFFLATMTKGDHPHAANNYILVYNGLQNWRMCFKYKLQMKRNKEKRIALNSAGVFGSMFRYLI